MVHVATTVAVGIENPTIFENPSQRSITPSASTMTSDGGAGRPYASTTTEEQAGSPTTTESGMQSSKLTGSSRSAVASQATKLTASITSNDLPTATRMRTVSSPLAEEGARWATTADGNVSDQGMTTRNAMAKSTTTSSEDGPSSTMDKRVARASSPGEVSDAQDRMSSPSARSSTLKGSSVTTSTSPSPTRTDGSYSTQAHTEEMMRRQ